MPPFKISCWKSAAAPRQGEGGEEPKSGRRGDDGSIVARVEDVIGDDC